MADLPLVLRAMLALDRAVLRLSRLVSLVVEEAAHAYIPLKRRGAVTAAIYARQPTFSPGGVRYEGGLFDWERRLLGSPHVPRVGRALVGGAGSGREAVALLDDGWSVVAFDPSQALVDRGQQALAGRPAALIRASYDDLVSAVRGGATPLAPLLPGAPFDLVVLGWGSLPHVLDARERRAVLEATQLLAPHAPVIVSFLALTAPEATRGASARTRRIVRPLLRVAGGWSSRGEGDRFLSWGGFVHAMTEDEMRALAQSAGYEVAECSIEGYGHALLVPPIREPPEARKP